MRFGQQSALPSRVMWWSSPVRDTRISRNTVMARVVSSRCEPLYHCGLYPGPSKSRGLNIGCRDMDAVEALWFDVT